MKEMIINVNLCKDTPNTFLGFSLILHPFQTLLHSALYKVKELLFLCEHALLDAYAAIKSANLWSTTSEKQK